MGEERENLRLPQGLAQMTKACGTIHTRRNASLKEKIVSMILNMLSWRSLRDCQGKVDAGWRDLMAVFSETRTRNHILPWIFVLFQDSKKKVLIPNC